MQPFLLSGTNATYATFSMSHVM